MFVDDLKKDIYMYIMSVVKNMFKHLRDSQTLKDFHYSSIL